MPKKTPVRKYPVAPGPYRLLCQSFTSPDVELLNRAYVAAGTLVDKPFEKMSNVGSAGAFIDDEADHWLRQYAPDLLDSDEWGHHSGDAHAALIHPSFALGFALAYRLFAEKGGAPYRIWRIFQSR